MAPKQNNECSSPGYFEKNLWEIRGIDETLELVRWLKKFPGSINPEMFQAFSKTEIFCLLADHHR